MAGRLSRMTGCGCGCASSLLQPCELPQRAQKPRKRALRMPARSSVSASWEVGFRPAYNTSGRKNFRVLGSQIAISLDTFWSQRTHGKVARQDDRHTVTCLTHTARHGKCVTLAAASMAVAVVLAMLAAAEKVPAAARSGLTRRPAVQCRRPASGVLPLPRAYCCGCAARC